MKSYVKPNVVVDFLDIETCSGIGEVRTGARSISRKLYSTHVSIIKRLDHVQHMEPYRLHKDWLAMGEMAFRCGETSVSIDLKSCLWSYCSALYVGVPTLRELYAPTLRENTRVQ